MSYKCYMTDIVKAIAESSGHCRIAYRWAELLQGSETDERTTEEVTADIIEGLEKILGKEEEKQ